MFFKIGIVKIYFLGIGGTAMGNAAIMFKGLGHSVLGADELLYPPMSNILEDAELEYYEGYDAERLAKLAPDLVIVGNAISRGNVEVEWLLNTESIRLMSLPQLLSEFVLKERKPVVISGTHGKTTTASIIAYLLKHNNLSPGWFIGGAPKSLPSGAVIGSGDSFVIEGDEYDSAFFDKRSKFIHYRPLIVAVNNIEMDHADIFRDLKDIQRSFEHLFRIIPSNGFLVVNGDDPNIEPLLEIDWCKVLKVGTGITNDLRIEGFKEDADGSSFNLIYKGELWTEVRWSLHGLYNARNAAIAAFSAALSTALSSDPNQVIRFDLGSLKDFKGVTRRQEELFKSEELLVLEDFAHHPTAIQHILRSMHSVYPEHEIITCFEPRSNTAKSGLFQDAFTESFKQSSELLIGRLHRSSLLKDESKLDRARICSQLNALGIHASAYDCNDQLLSALINRLNGNSAERKKSLVIFFTNGSFDGIMEKLILKLSE